MCIGLGPHYPSQLVSVQIRKNHMKKYESKPHLGSQAPPEGVCPPARVKGYNKQTPGQTLKGYVYQHNFIPSCAAIDGKLSPN